MLELNHENIEVTKIQTCSPDDMAELSALRNRGKNTAFSPLDNQINAVFRSSVEFTKSVTCFQM